MRRNMRGQGGKARSVDKILWDSARQDTPSLVGTVRASVSGELLSVGNGVRTGDGPPSVGSQIATMIFVVVLFGLSSCLGDVAQVGGSAGRSATGKPGVNDRAGPKSRRSAEGCDSRCVLILVDPVIGKTWSSPPDCLTCGTTQESTTGTSSARGFHRETSMRALSQVCTRVA